MERSHTIIGIISIALIAIAYLAFNRQQDTILAQANLTLKTEQIDYQRAIIAQKKADIRRNAEFTFWAWAIGSSMIVFTACFSVFLYVASLSQAKRKQAKIHMLKVNEHSAIPIHEKDLELMPQIAIETLAGEKLHQIAGGTDVAFDYFERMGRLAAENTKAILGARQQAYHQPALPQAPQLMLPAASTETPTFAQLIDTEELAPGREMILCYEQGRPIRGSMLDIYSSAVAGESGGGKTSTMLFLIGSGLITSEIRFFGIDPHYPHPKSLGFKTKPLWENGLMRMATYKDDMLAVLTHIRTTIDRRLRQEDTDTTPIVLVIDELLKLQGSSIAATLTKTMETISTEGRKCAVYMLVSSHTWLAARTGKDSVARDTLTSAYVHRIKPKQANLLLQDPSTMEYVRKLKRAGEVVFCPVNNAPRIGCMPYTTEHDMQMLADRLAKKSSFTSGTEAPREPIRQAAVSSGLEQIVAPGGSHALPEGKLTNLVQELNDRFDQAKAADPKLTKTSWQEQVAPQIELSAPLLKSVMNGTRQLTSDTTPKIANFLQNEKAV